MRPDEWEKRGAAGTYSQAKPARVPDCSPIEGMGSGGDPADLPSDPQRRPFQSGKLGGPCPLHGESFFSREWACWSTRQVRRG